MTAPTPPEPGDAAWMESHWEKMGPQAAQDFRTVAVSLKALRLLGPDPGPILDVGCGYGVLVLHAHRRGHRVLGIDTSERQIAGAAAVLASQGAPAELVRVESLAALADAGQQFRACAALDVLEHIGARADFLGQMRRVLAPDGRLVVSVPAIPAFYDERDRLSGHYLRYDPATLRAHLAEGGFAVEYLQYWNWLGWFQRRLKQRALRAQRAQSTQNTPPAEYYGFRYGGSWQARALNRALRAYFLAFENRLRPPVGLSLLAVARPAPAADSAAASAASRPPAH